MKHIMKITTIFVFLIIFSDELYAGWQQSRITAIKREVLPGLEAARREPSFERKLDLLIRELSSFPGMAKGKNFGHLSGEGAERDVRRLKSALENMRSLLGRKDLKGQDLSDAKVSVNALLDYFMASAKMSITELESDQKFTEHWTEKEERAKNDESTGWQTMKEFGNLFKRLLYTDRVSLLHVIPTIGNAGRYNMALTRIEAINSRNQGDSQQADHNSSSGTRTSN
ncbi:MAG: hypothetical protein KDD33_10695 [Bdellovibrionales bacterium]|nr:hypothetical protein [Bdellovibrionales bacterium]